MSAKQTVRERTLKNAWMAAVQVISVSVTLFALYFFLLRTVGVYELGLWSTIIAFVGLMRIGEFGLPGAIVARTAERYRKGERAAAAAKVITAAAAVAATMVVLAALAILVMASLAQSNSRSLLFLSSVAILGTAASSVANVFLAALDAEQRGSTKSLLTIGSSATYLGLALVLVPIWGIDGLGLAYLLQNILTLSAAALCSRTLHVARGVGRPNRRDLADLWAYGAHFQANSILSLLFDPITKAALSRIGDFSSVGYFEMANKMVMQVRSLMASAVQVIVPIIASSGDNDAQSRRQRIARVYLTAVQLTVLLAGTTYALVAGNVKTISLLWLGHASIDFELFSALLCLGWLANSLAAPAFFSNLGTGNLRPNTLSTAIAVVLNAALSWSLGAAFGPIGVVVGFSAALIFSSLFVVRDYNSSNQNELSNSMQRRHSVFIALAVASVTLGWLSDDLTRYSSLGVRAGVAFAAVALPLAAAILFQHEFRSVLAQLLVRRSR